MINPTVRIVLLSVLAVASTVAEAQEKAAGTVVKPTETDADAVPAADDGPRGTAKLRRLTGDPEDKTDNPDRSKAPTNEVETSAGAGDRNDRGLIDSLPPPSPGPKRVRVPGAAPPPNAAPSDTAADTERAFEIAREAYEAKDYETALAVYRDLAERGEALAMYALGRIHSRGDGVAKNEQTAFQWFLRAAEAGNPDAQFSVSFRLWEGRGTPVDREAALAWTKAAAEAGQPNAQYNWAWLHHQGEAVETNMDVAVRYYRLAAEQGLAKAQNALAALYLEGEGVERDRRRAEELFRDAARQGIEGAAEKLEDLVEDRHAASFRKAKALIERQAFAKARDLLEPMAAENHAPSLNELGIMAFWGFGRKADKTAALELFQKAGALGHPASQANLGMLYLKGAGVERDLQLAHAWFTLAEAGGVRAAAKGVEAVRSRLSPDQIDAAKEIAERIRRGYASPEASADD